MVEKISATTLTGIQFDIETTTDSDGPIRIYDIQPYKMDPPTITAYNVKEFPVGDERCLGWPQSKRNEAETRSSSHWSEKWPRSENWTLLTLRRRNLDRDGIEYRMIYSIDVNLWDTGQRTDFHSLGHVVWLYRQEC